MEKNKELLCESEELFNLSFMSPAQFYELYKGYNHCPEAMNHWFPENWYPYKIQQFMEAEVDRRNEEYANEEFRKFTEREQKRLKRFQENYVDEPEKDMRLETKMQLAHRALAFMQRPEIIENGYSYDQDEYDDLCACFGSHLLCEDHLSSEDK